MENFTQPEIEAYEKTKHSRHLKDWMSTIAVIVLAPLLALFLTTFVFQTYEVDGPSMLNTLNHKDRLIVLKAPKSWARLTGKTYLPKRYDIIVFNHAGIAATNDQKQLIKRVIGLPGDRVVIKGSVVTIYNNEHPDGFLVDREGPAANTIHSSPGTIDQVVEPNRVFVLGDNRDNSLDSPDFGTVASSDIVGKLVLRIYPFNQFDKF